MVELAARLDAELPQTQCGRCGFGGCRPYAEAMARGEAPINRCPPGGSPTMQTLARLLHVAQLALDASCGTEETSAVVVRVIERDCIGCALCLDACPVDAIIGAPKQMHTVIDLECTGCELCIPVCPVDCIEITPRRSDPLLARERAPRSRQRFELHQARLAQEQARQRDRRGTRAASGDASIESLLAAARQSSGRGKPA
jgi:electron transport complex protein RnfB